MYGIKELNANNFYTGLFLTEIEVLPLKICQKYQRGKFQYVSKSIEKMIP